MINPIIRNGLAQDIKGIYVADQDAFGTGSYDIYLLRQAVEALKGTLVVAVEKEQVLGYGLGVVNVYEQSGWVLSLAVHHTYRSLGIGTALLNTLTERFSEYKCQNMKLAVRPDNERAIQLYSRLGFQITEFIPDYVPGEDRFIMTKTLISKEIDGVWILYTNLCGLLQPIAKKFANAIRTIQLIDKP